MPVPAHPVAGTEQSGPDAGFATLFVGRWCILTPPEGTPHEAVARVSAFWEGLGAKVEMMEAAHHDLVLAVTSHLPHLIAYTIVGTASDLEEVTQSEVIKYSAGVSAISPVSPPPTRRCGATCSSTTATPCSPCCKSSPKT
jgi:cyclohexadieny/prephenate dehydrogenase